jgi:hypothetical protein
MGFLKKLFGSRAAVQQLPTGSITVDRDGQIVTSTVSSRYPQPPLRAVGRNMMQLFRESRSARMPFTELDIHFGSLHLTARELRGGTIIFISPQTTFAPTQPDLRL